jgi:nitroreductase
MSVKLADTKYPIHELLTRRWSPRAFSECPVEPEKLRSLLEAARWAPSSFNEQPWSFIVVTKDDQAQYQRLLSCLEEGNREWAWQAPVLMLSIAKLYLESNNEENKTALYDVGLAAANLVIQATALGLGVHQMAGFDREKTRETYGIPEGYLPVAVIALGYYGDPDTLHEKLRKRELAPRTRKPLGQFVFTERFGQASPLVDSH